MIPLEREGNYSELSIDKYSPENAAQIITFAALKTIQRKDKGLDDVLYTQKDDTLRLFSGFRAFSVPAAETAKQSRQEITQDHILTMQKLAEQGMQRQQMQERQLSHEEAEL